MSGILDNKSRVIDAILTFEGRRQMVDGNFEAKYVTFSDNSVVYQADKQDGHVDPTSKIYLECYNSPYDQIFFEADDSGALVPFRQHVNYSFGSGSITGSVSWLSFNSGMIKSRTQEFAQNSALGSSFRENSIAGSSFASQIEGLLTSSIDNFRNLRVIGSADSLFEDQEFALSSNEIRFSIPDNQSIASMLIPTDINTVDALFSDEKLRNVINFKYLPPIKKASYSVNKKDINALKDANLFLGNYPPWGPTDPLTFSQIKKELSDYEKSYPSKSLIFDPTSRDNEVVAQMFEIRDGSVQKLDVIDYGSVNNNPQNPVAETNRVFFVGKVMMDETGSDCFLHLFTLVFGMKEEQ
jgi:hypothetical protein